MNVFSELKGFLKIEKVAIDNTLFKLHYKVTSITLLAFSAVIASKQHFGNPIECLSDTATYSKTDDMKDALNTYCWIQSTYSVPELLNGTVGKNVVYPGVGPVDYRTQNKTHHKYYQWIVFVLFFQAMAFLTPHFIWKLCENGKMSMLSTGLTNPLQEQDLTTTRRKLLLEYFIGNVGYHNAYFSYFFLCELSNLINVVVQIYITNLILGKQFTTYGSDIIVSYMEEVRNSNSVRFYNDIKNRNIVNRVSPMTKVFPRIAKCTLHVYGPGGNIQSHDAICMLPLNIINEKIYIILWFWFLTLTLVSTLGFIYRLMTLCCQPIRHFILKSIIRFNDAEAVRIICERCNVADWFVLCQLSENIEVLVYRDLINDLGNKFGESKRVSFPKNVLVDNDVNINHSCNNRLEIESLELMRNSPLTDLPPPPLNWLGQDNKAFTAN